MFNGIEKKPIISFFQDSKLKDDAISQIPLKKIYTRFTAQQITIDPNKPNVISITGTTSAQVFCFFVYFLDLF